ncbi:MAG: hypothetical protein NTY45_14480 [Elusimicrobia bacterium]|nr:hypothetical protein [Elusimicrobiota bacterium]
MNKLAALFTLVLTFGFSFPGAAQPGPGEQHPKPGVQQQAGDITPAQIFNAFGALINAANGGQHGGPGFPGQQPGGFPGGHNGGYPGGSHNPPPPVPQPGPWHPQPGFPQGQFQKLNSIGSYASSSEAEAAKNETVRALGELRVMVAEARVEYNSGYRFVITYSSREQLTVNQYRGGTYPSSTDARKAADMTAAALKAKGSKVVVETPVFYNSGYTYIVGYVNLYQGQDPDDQLQKLPSITAYPTSTEADAAKTAAVNLLKSFEVTVLEARVEYNSGYRFVITYALREPMPEEQYRGGTYPTSTDARNAANQTAEALRAKGKAIVETPVFYNSGYTYIIAYVTVAQQGHHQTDQLQTLSSIGAYATSTEAEAAKAAAVAALGELRLTVLESRVAYNSGYRFTITYNARQPLNVEQYNGGAYPTSAGARQGADQTVAAMRAQGNIVVLETPVFYSSGYTYSVSYVTRRW